MCGAKPCRYDPDRDRARDAIIRVIGVCDTLVELTQMAFEDFATDARSQWAVEMELIRIGECVNRIPETVLSRFPAQPWRQIVGMRNFAAHQYDDLDPRRAWRTVTVNVPALRTYLVDVILGEL